MNLYNLPPPRVEESLSPPNMFLFRWGLINLDGKDPPLPT